MSSNTAQLIQMADALSTHDVGRLKARLLDQARQLSAQDSELRARLAADESATANTFVAGIEGGMAAEADDETIAFLHHEQCELAATKQALERIERGEYGLCEECGEAIGLARLEVLPEAHLCVNCQDMAEHRKGR